MTNLLIPKGLNFPLFGLNREGGIELIQANVHLLMRPANRVNLSDTDKLALFLQQHW